MVHVPTVMWQFHIHLCEPVLMLMFFYFIKHSFYKFLATCSQQNGNINYSSGISLIFIIFFSEV